MKNKLIIAIIASLIVGFVAGMEFKAYQVRQAFQKADQEIQTAVNSGQPVVEQARKANLKVINKVKGDDVQLATLRVKINSSEEKNMLSGGYGAPKVADQNAKFVIINATITNSTSSQFTFFPDDGFRLVDQNNREFQTYDNTIGSIENYLNSRELSPDVEESGVIVYEVPKDSNSYSIVVGKSGTDEVYHILVK